MTKVTYRKARRLDDLLVDERPEQVMLGHRENLRDGILCLSRSEFDSLNGRQILKRFNAYIDSLLRGIATDRPIEISDGEPQVKWSKTCENWTAVGDVLRCVVGWNNKPKGRNGVGEVSIQIDDKNLTGEEFLRLIETFEGWGMRIEFMHPNRLTKPPKPIVQAKGRSVY